MSTAVVALMAAGEAFNLHVSFVLAMYVLCVAWVNVWNKLVHSCLGLQTPTTTTVCACQLTAFLCECVYCVACVV